MSRVSHLNKILALQKFNIKITNQSELLKCLQSAKNLNVSIDNNTFIYRDNLQQIGNSLLHLHINEMYLTLFKDNNSNNGTLSNFNFNYMNSLKFKSNWKINPNSLIKKYLSTSNLNNLSILSIPDNKIPQRIRLKFDLLAFNSLIGYLLISNDKKTIDNLIKDSIIPVLIKLILN
ncbi:hypothetical protein Kpol_1055p75 [Vanderwaltozyma polyspora DSM 70294]|uniref:Uncharacterized protein n=1 Tax=Vanderwaltozyma polyspora (strain ATCC 22028 / DSM 70294 / BCRC 21397 / CBS 2163 / NBRC 10782 / NRRL Y-8283 / UCD 57-17) TaxID=436907 RepID=A7TGE8_VANPO|nr:uncharacterized protein Kpol_1055p75 [Vanderwaltozyma polyspora DSM 70294]EDO18718.1 hypothetical protein Kpol_1055p75 [Vanderwaltozyma polyspora DSM 70294]